MNKRMLNCLVHKLKSTEKKKRKEGIRNRVYVKYGMNN